MLVLYTNYIPIISFNTKMKTNMAPWHLRKKEGHLDADDICTMT